MAELQIGKIGLEGFTLNLVSADSGGDSFRNTSNDNVLFLENTGASEVTVTIVAQKKCNHGVLHDKEITVPAGEQVAVADIERSRFNDDNNMVHVTYSDATDILAGVGYTD